jgi:signal peptidase I
MTKAERAGDVRGGRSGSVPRTVRPDRAAARRAPADRRKDTALEWVKSLAIAFVLFIIIRTFLVQTFVITSGSMEQTLLVGDFLMISKAAYGPRIPGTSVRLPGYTTPDHGDIVIFRAEHEPGMDLVKRVVGLPGDTVEMRARAFFRNGQPVEEPYAINPPGAPNVTHPWMAWQQQFLLESADDYRATLHDWGPLVVPPDRYFTMGDNRDDSLDSRYWGFVDAAEVRGEALFIYFSYERGAGRPLAWLREVRWGRLGQRIR